MNRVSFWLWAFAALVVGGGLAGYEFLRSFNHFDKIEAKFAGSCAPVTGIAGPEDIQVDGVARRAFISSHDRSNGQSARGAVHVFSLDDPLAAGAWRDRTHGLPADFAPLGLHYYEEDGLRRLFVVNAAASAVELFDVAENGDLTHLETFRERRLTSPNDVFAVGPRAFYVTNDADPGRDSLLGRLHFLLRIGSGRVLYYNGVSWLAAAEGLRFANGLAVSASGDRFYVAETAAGALRIYERDPQSGLLGSFAIVPTDAAPENINIDDGGALWIAAHPKPLDLPVYARGGIGRAPSQVLRYDDIAGVRSKPAVIYQDDGEEISASTAAARLGSTLLIGALLEKKFLICNLPA